MKKASPQKQLPVSLEEACEIEVDHALGKILKGADQELIGYLESGKTSVTNIETLIKEQVFVLMKLYDLFKSHPGKLGSYIAEQRIDIVHSLGSLAELIIIILGVQSKRSDSDAAEALWDIAMKSVEDVGVLADLHPELLKKRARKSMYMPSRRALTVKFTDNFLARAHKIELSKGTSIKATDKALYDLESKATLFAVNLLNKAKENRKLIRSVWRLKEIQDFELKIGTDAMFRFMGISLQEALAYREIKPYCKATAKSWWEKIISPIIGQDETLELIKNDDKAFYEYLVRSAKLATDSEIRQKLKDLCKRQVLNSLAPDKPTTEE